MKRLDLVVGPNGAGKSTFIAFTLSPLLPGSAIVNADEIARRKWPTEAAAHSYEAARIAAATRSALIERGRTFIAETVFSHPSKLELLEEAHAVGYTVVVHVLLIPENLAHRRLWPLVVAAAERADLATVYDNSQLAGPRIVARLAGGEVIGSPDWPTWAPQPLAARWPKD